MSVLSRVLQSAGRQSGAVTAMAFAQPSGPPQVNREPVFEAHMMIAPAGPRSSETPEDVGITCRICPRAACPARREPSLLGDGLAQGF